MMRGIAVVVTILISGEGGCLISCRITQVSFFSGGGRPLFYLKGTETPLPTLVTVEATPCHFFSAWFAFEIEARR